MARAPEENLANVEFRKSVAEMRRDLKIIHWMMAANNVLTAIILILLLVGFGP